MRFKVGQICIINQGPGNWLNGCKIEITDLPSVGVYLYYKGIVTYKTAQGSDWWARIGDKVTFKESQLLPFEKKINPTYRQCLEILNV